MFTDIVTRRYGDPRGFHLAGAGSGAPPTEMPPLGLRAAGFFRGARDAARATGCGGLPRRPAPEANRLFQTEELVVPTDALSQPAAPRGFVPSTALNARFVVLTRESLPVLRAGRAGLVLTPRRKRTTEGAPYRRTGGKPTAFRSLPARRQPLLTPKVGAAPSQWNDVKFVHQEVL